MKHDMKSRIIIWGERLFKMRSYTPIPLFLVMLSCFWWEWENGIMVWCFGLFFVACGEGMRIWSLRYIGRFSRTTRKRKGNALVMDGPYTLVRNPLYCGNLLILIGATILSELLWFIPIVIILFSLQYYCIVLWEEETLLKNFPEETERYFRSVPRWLPSWHSIQKYFEQNRTADYPWLNVLRREQSTLLGLFTMVTFMLVKELLLSKSF